MLPSINSGSRSNSGLGAFYAANGLSGQQQQSSPQGGSLGGFGDLGNGIGYQQRHFTSQNVPGRPVSFPAVRPGMPSTQQPQLSSQQGAVHPQAQMGANPLVGAMMNMQVQMMHKRQANMMLKQRALQQQQMQRMQVGQKQEGVQMGMRPLVPRGGAVAPRQAPIAPSEASDSRSLPGPGQPQPGVEDAAPQHAYPSPGSPSQQQEDPQKVAFDIGQKMAQMDQMLREAKEEKERKADEARQAKEESERQQKVREKEETDKQVQREDDDLDLEDLSLLAKLEHEIRDKIQENDATLHELDMTDEELKLAAEMAGKEAMKEKFKEKLALGERRGKGRVPLQPLWRHRMDGVQSVPKDRILKGKALLRACVWGIVIMYVRPLLNIRKRKEVYSSKNAVEFKRTLEAFSEACSAWWGNLLKIPILSIQEDSSLTLRPYKRGTFDKVRIDEQNMLSLKVRTLRITKTLVESRMPPDYVTQFLVSLVDDDNYFYKGFFYPEEEKKIELDEFGGTRGMVREPADKSDLDVSKPCTRGQAILGEKSLKKRKVDASRARLLLQNFVFLRCLINNCLVTPWTFRVGRKPTKEQANKVVDNLRVIATMLYLAVKGVSEHLPEIRPDLRKKYWNKLPKAEREKDEDFQDDDKDGKGNASTSGKKNGGDADAGDSSAQGAGNKQSDANAQAGDGGGDHDDSSSVSSTSSAETEAEGGSGKTAYKEGTVMNYLFGKRATGKGKDKDTRRGPEDFLRDDLLYSTRPPFCSLLSTVDNLIDEDEFVNNRKEIEEWLPEASKAIDEYTDKLLVHVLESREGVLHDEVHDLVEGHEEAPDGEMSAEQQQQKLEAKLTARREEREAQEQKVKARVEAVLGVDGGRSTSIADGAEADPNLVITARAEGTDVGGSTRPTPRPPPPGVGLDLEKAGLSSVRQGTAQRTERKISMKPPTPAEQAKAMD